MKMIFAPDINNIQDEVYSKHMIYLKILTLTFYMTPAIFRFSYWHPPT